MASIGVDRHLLHRQEEQCRALRRHQLHVTVVRNGRDPLCLSLRCVVLKIGQTYGHNRLRPEQVVHERMDLARDFGSESGTFLASQMKSYRNGNLKCRKDERGRVVPTSITDHRYPRLVPVQYKFEETKRGLANVMDFPKGSLAESQT
jgi:hypothetical protein